MNTLQAVRTLLRKQLNNLYPPEEITAIGKILLEETLQISREQLYLLDKDTLLEVDTFSRLQNQIQRLALGEPIQYILGYTYFAGARIEVSEGVLIPRPETEELVELIIQQEQKIEGLRIMDFCTGSACIPLALAQSNLIIQKLDALDISPLAIRLANKNIDLHTPIGRSIQLYQADLLQMQYIPNIPYDIIVSNPPYIHPQEANKMNSNVLQYEPHTALFTPQSSPTLFYNHIAQLAEKGWLAKGGRLYFEINPIYAQETLESVSYYLQEKFEKGEIITDLSGHQRFIYIKTKE